MWPSLQKSSKVRFSFGQAVTNSESSLAYSSQTLIQYLENLSNIYIKVSEKNINEKRSETQAHQALIHSSETFFKSPSQPDHRKINCVEGKTAIVDKSTISSINLAEAMKDLPRGSSLSVNCAESTEKGGIAIVADFNSMSPEVANMLRGFTNGW